MTSSKQINALIYFVTFSLCDLKVATVELQIQDDTSEFLLSAFVITTASLVSACLLVSFSESSA